MNKDVKTNIIVEKIVEIILLIVATVFVLMSNSIDSQLRLIVLIALGTNILYSTVLLIKNILKNEVVKKE